MIQIMEHVIESLVDHARAEKPIEACGYLAGAGKLITDSFRMTNADKSGEHYSFVPEEQFRILRAAREKGLNLIGVYHSHPSTPARMSEEDLRLAYDKSMIYLIVSLASAEADIRAFAVKGEDALNEEIQILKGGWGHE